MFCQLAVSCFVLSGDSAVETFDVKSCRSKLAEHYKRTASVPTSVWTKKSPVDIHQIYTRLSWVKEEQTLAGSSQSELKHYTDVFTTNNDVVPKRILVQGQTGIGKSTFVKKLSVDFAECDDETTGDTKKGALRRFEDGGDVLVSEVKEAAFQDYEDSSRSSGKHEDMSENQKESLKKFELVLVINLKEKSKCPSLREIVRCCSIFPEEETALVDDLLSYITKNQEKVLLVFDGYDEYRCGSNSEIYEIFRGKKLRNCCVLITTRISKADGLREFKDVHAEITGFSEKDRVDFMIKFLGGKAEAEAEELRRYLSRKKLTDLTRVPLLLLFFCTLWKKGKLTSFPETKTKLYVGIVQYVLDYNQGKDSPARFGKVHDFKDILAEIGKVALECLLKDDHVFEYDELSAAILCDESFIIGLLQVTEYAENLRPSGMVSFIHKSIQEFLAAWYIANSCVPDGNLGGIEQHALTLEDFQAWENVFQFVCGLSDDGAVTVFHLLTSLRISDPTLDVSKIVPDVENETVVPLCDVTDRHESFRNVVYDSFQEVRSKAELLSNWFDCNGGIFLVSTERSLPDLIPKVDDFTKLAHSRGSQVIFGRNSMVYELLKFLDCLHTLISKSESSEVFNVKNFLGKLEEIFFVSSISSILCFRNGKCYIYFTGLELFDDEDAHLFAETIVDSFLSPSANMRSEWSCLKFLTSLRCWCGLSGQSCRALGAAIKDCEHLKRIVVHDCDDSVTELLEHVRRPSKCSLEIGAFVRAKEGKCDLTSSGAVKFASLISKFDNIISLCLDFSNCCSAAVDTLVASITHNTLKRLVLHGTRLTLTVAALLGRSLPEMSFLKVLKLTGLDGNILEAEEMEALFGRFNKTLPLSRLTLSGFSVGGCLSSLAKSLPFFPTLGELTLEQLNMDEHAQCSLLQSFGFIPNLKVMKVQSKALRHPCCCTTKVSTGRGHRLGDYKTLELNGISLTQTVAAALGRLLPEMSFLQELELTDVDGSSLQAEEMEALFGRCNTMMPLCKLVFSGFKVGGCLAPLTKSFHFFPNLRELKLEKLNMNENDQCGLLESLPFIRNLTVLNIQTRPLGDADCCMAELKTDDYFRQTAIKRLTLKGIIFTQATTSALGQSLPEMLSLQALEVTGVRHESILQTKEIEALFGRFNGVLPLYSLIFRDFSVTGSIAPLTKSFCYFPNLVELNLAEINMDEHNSCGLLENLRFVPNLMELRVDGKPLDRADCCTAKGNTVGGFPLKNLKELTLYKVCLTPAVTSMLGQILPEMSSLEEFVLSGVDGSVIKAEEMEALFGGLNKTLPLHHLTFSVFSVRGSFAPLKSFRFLANLRVLHLGGLNMGEHNLCALLESLKFIPDLKVLTVEGSPQGDAHCCSAELNVMASITHKTLEHLTLDGISLTPVSAALLGRSLPEMSSLQVLELTGVDGSIQLQAKEMEALLGGFNKTLPLYRLTLRNFSSRGCLATLCKSFRFFPNLRQLSLGQMNMDERDVCSLLQNLRFIRSLRALRVQSEDQRDAGCYTAKLNTFGSSTIEIHEKLNLNGISLTPAAAAALGRSLPEMASLQILEITGRDRRILQGEEMEALFGGFDKPIPLRELTFSGFSVRGCLAPLIKSLHFFPNLTELRLERLNVDENDQCGLLKSFGPIRNLTELSVWIRRWSDLNSFHYHSFKTNIFDRLAHDRDLLEKRLKVGGISLTPAVAAVFGLLLPEMSFLHTLEVTGVNRSILEAEEIEALFGRFNKTLPLHRLTLKSLSMKGCLSPLYRNFHLFPSLRELDLKDLDLGEHDSCFLKPLCCKAEITVRVCSGKVTCKNLEQLKLDRIRLTPAAAVALGQSLPEMSSLQVLQLTHIDRSILQAEEMEALFGGFNKRMPLFLLTLNGFSVRGCLAPLFRSLRFFPNLTELNLEMLNMDEHDLNGLLESFQFIPNLQELVLSRNPLAHSVRCIVPHVINLKKLRSLWIEQTNHSEEDLIYVRDTVQQALPELKIRGDTGLSSGCNQM